MELKVYRTATDERGDTFGQLKDESEDATSYLCYTLEPAIREQPGVPVHEWKVDGHTAIPAGRYRLTFEDSPHFGPDTLTVNDVPGFEDIRIHGGSTVRDTRGCTLVGNRVNKDLGEIHGAKLDRVLDLLKDHVRDAIAAGDCTIEYVNP